MTDQQFGPDPHTVYPLNGMERLCFLKNIIQNPLIIVGDYTYYDDWEDVRNFEKNVLYHFDFIGDKLIIGKFCAIAHGVKFIMNGGNHQVNSYSTYPFGIFGNGWQNTQSAEGDNKGDTVIGNDVWIGYAATIMPGIHIGDGAIIASQSVVTKNVEPYTIVGGNPAQVIRKRFDQQVIDMLLKLQWWDWPADKITANLDLLTSHDPLQLAKFCADEKS